MTAERVRVGDVLRLQRHEVVVEPETEYRLIGVYSFGKGIFHREPKPGAGLGNYRFFAIAPGDLVLSNIQAWEGAIALASQQDAGTIGTHRFLTYVPIDQRIDTNWARWFFLSEQGMILIQQAAPGTTIRNRTLARDRFEALEIPLPPIAEQHSVAQRLARLHAAMSDLNRRSSRASALIESLAVSASTRPDLTDEVKARAGWRRVELGSVMTQSTSQVSVELDKTYPNVGIYSFGRGLFPKADIEGSTTSAKVLNRIRAGQFIYSRLFAFEGAYAYVPAQFDGYCVSIEFPTFDTDPEQLDARWLASYLRSRDHWAELGGASKGLGVRRQRVLVEAVMSYQVWLPPITAQRAIVTTVERLSQCRMDHVQSEQRIASLVPAALNREFVSLADH